MIIIVIIIIIFNNNNNHNDINNNNNNNNSNDNNDNDNKKKKKKNTPDIIFLFSCLQIYFGHKKLGHGQLWLRCKYELFKQFSITKNNRTIRDVTIAGRDVKRTYILIVKPYFYLFCHEESFSFESVHFFSSFVSKL